MYKNDSGKTDILSKMKRYYIKCESGRQEFLDVIQDTGDDLLIRLTRIKNGYQKTMEERISRCLFNSCLKTGYITEIKEREVSVAWILLLIEHLKTLILFLWKSEQKFF